MSVRKIGFALLLALLLGSAVGLRTNTSLASREAAPSFSPQTGQYTVDFDPKSGHLFIRRVGRKAALQLTELPGRRSRNLLASARSARVVGGAFVVRGSTPWTAFTFRVSLTRTPGLIHYTLTLNPRANAPSVRFALPDIRLVRGSGGLHEYAPAPPIAGNSVFLSIPALGS
ncbi:MAG: hypothetical protein M3Z66_18985, partial [Chloroflexota bacterium]|nr:hypothetical protein [Chloroflexota bacterium]